MGHGGPLGGACRARHVGTRRHRVKGVESADGSAFDMLLPRHRGSHADDGRSHEAESSADAAEGEIAVVEVIP